MNALDTQFIFDAPQGDFAISFAAHAIDCGSLFAVAAPRLEDGLLFMVKSGVSSVYTFLAADGITLTVTDTSFIYKADIIKRHIRKTPRAVFATMPVRFTPVRRISVLRL